MIDEYSLKGAKGLLVNITGGNDLTMFEVDEITNKIRAEVDPEADLITGSIEDESLTGKIRVSIVATSLDGCEPDTKPVVSMVHRLHNRNVGYSNKVTETLGANQATLNATEGATALNLNHVVEENIITQQINKQESTPINDPALENISIENAAYLQNIEDTSVNINPDLESQDIPSFEVESIELASPELFSDNSLDSEISNTIQEKEPKIFDNTKSEKEKVTKEPEMFDETNLEEDFEIPAFLRRQKN